MEKTDLYLNDVAEEQGFLFEDIVEQGFDLFDFVKMYMQSPYKEKIDNRNPWFTNQMYYEQLEYFRKHYTLKRKEQQYDSVLAEWVGELLAYLQAYKQVPSKQLIQQIPIELLYKKAYVLHDLDMDVAVHRVGAAL